MCDLQDRLFAYVQVFFGNAQKRGLFFVRAEKRVRILFLERYLHPAIELLSTDISLILRCSCRSQLFNAFKFPVFGNHA